MGPNTFFRRVIVERGPGDNMAARKYPLVGRDEMRRIVFCSGQIFYELYHARTARKIRDVTFVRIEQIAPFPFDRIASVLRLYPNADWCWAQQEPKNMGAWSYVQPRFRTAVKKLCEDVKDRDLHYVGRPVSAAPATGLFRRHLDENKVKEPSNCEPRKIPSGTARHMRTHLGKPQPSPGVEMAQRGQLTNTHTHTHTK